MTISEVRAIALIWFNKSCSKLPVRLPDWKELLFEREEIRHGNLGRCGFYWWEMCMS